MRMLIILFLALFALACEPETPAAQQQPPVERPVVPATEVPEPDATTRRLFNETMAFATSQDLRHQPLGAVMQELGLHFRGRPYAEGTLDVPETEILVVKLDGFDCVTFVETMLAMAQGITEGDTTYTGFAERLEALRYRHGLRDGYATRLHYFSEWIADNEARGQVKNVTVELGGERLEKQLNFMSTHRESYPRMATDDATFAQIRTAEANLIDLEIFYIPQDQIASVYDQLRAGDIIATATHIDGLDVTHTGLVFKDEAQTGFLHASLSDGVTVSPDLQSYIQNNKSQIGIVVARPL